MFSSAKMRRFLRRVFCCILALLLLAPAAEARDKKPQIHAGYRTLSASLPSQRIMLHIGVWYPTTRRPGIVKEGDRSFRSARNSAVLKGPWPVIMLSHDITGNAWAHHDIASALASSGFIVVAPTHDRDNAEDMRLLFTEQELPVRALQLSAALDHVLSHPQIGAQADTSRVGFLGFGLPSPAGLLLAGGELTPDGWDSFCESGDASNGSRRASPWCSGYTAERMDALVASMRHRTVEKEQKCRMLEFAVESHRKQFERAAASVARSHQRQLKHARKKNIPQPPTALPLLPQLAPETSVGDSRFKAFALVSPGFSMLFSPATLSRVNAPILLIGAGRDPFLLPSDHAERFAGMLPGKPEYLTIANATSDSFLAPCPASDPARELIGICAGTDTEQRRSIHTRAVLHLRDFFHRCFNSPDAL